MDQSSDVLFTWETIRLKLRTPFKLSYGASMERVAHWLRFQGDAAWGEGTIPPYYHIDEKEMVRYWQRNASRTDSLPRRVEDIQAWIDPDGPAPARAAVDIALHDLVSREQGQPLYAALGLPKPARKTSSFTISVDTPEGMAKEALRVSTYPIIKLKLGSDEEDMARLRAVRDARPDACLLVDANAGWTLDQALAYLPLLSRAEVALLEQPLPAADFEGLGKLQARTTIPIYADESVRSLLDVQSLAEVGVRGVNIKLMKVGGLGPALAMISYAKRATMAIMLGCMIETSIGLTAMSHLAGLADWLDLDASLLVTNDPFQGMRMDENAAVHVPNAPGLGVNVREES